MPEAIAPETVSPDQRSTLRRGWDWLKRNVGTTSAEAAPLTVEGWQGMSASARDAAYQQAMQATAAGSALMSTAAVERGPGGEDNLVIRTSARGAAISPQTAWGLWGAGATAETLLGVPGGSAIGHAAGRAGMYPEAGYGDIARGLILGMGTLEMMKRDDEQGNPMRDQMREWLGINPEAEGEWPPRPGGANPAQPNRSLFGSRLFGGGFFHQASYGGITAQDGWAFGSAAAESLRDGINGMSIPTGQSMTSYGVAPRHAPRPTGGDVASEA